MRIAWQSPLVPAREHPSGLHAVLAVLSAIVLIQRRCTLPVVVLVVRGHLIRRHKRECLQHVQSLTLLTPTGATFAWLLKQRSLSTKCLLRFPLRVAFLITMVDLDPKKCGLSKQINQLKSKQRRYKAGAIVAGAVTGTALLGLAAAAPVLTATGAAHGVSSVGMGALSVGGEAARKVLWEGAKAGGQSLYREATAPIPPSPMMVDIAKSAASN